MYRQMRYYIAVVETGSFFEAGEVCHISQSAVSQQVKALEAELKVALLERHGRTFSVTPAGQYFYQQAKRQTAALDTLVREVRRIDSGEYQRLRVGVLHGFSARIIRQAIQAFANRHPYAQLSLVTGTHEELFQPVNSGALDMVINDQWRALSNQYVNEKLLEQPLYAMIRKDHPLASCDTVEVEALQELLCILVAPPEQREREVAHWRDVMGLQSNYLFVDNVETACMNAEAGTGYYICDADIPHSDGSSLVPVLRNGLPLTRKMFAFWPESSSSSLQWEFTQILQALFK